MSINPSSFNLYNVTDTCAVWNVLSSLKLYNGAREANVVFVCTRFVMYECLYKPRQKPTAYDNKLKSRLRTAQNKSAFETYSLDVADLQSIDLLENRKRLGKGELSSIAFALKIRQTFLTDDQKARKFACKILTQSGTQTTPHLLAWLFFTNRLTDIDKDIVIREHREMGRPLERFFEEVYIEAYRCRLLAHQGDIAT
ncbi:MAG: hypothetical protein JRC92_08815 [Deltaproteobacteria bacterium]|nr:hypothetical protein [Deltaproteobacteria bacterium]